MFFVMGWDGWLGLCEYVIWFLKNMILKEYIGVCVCAHTRSVLFVLRSSCRSFGAETPFMEVATEAAQATLAASMSMERCGRVLLGRDCRPAKAWPYLHGSSAKVFSYAHIVLRGRGHGCFDVLIGAGVCLCVCVRTCHSLKLLSQNSQHPQILQTHA